jgi:decaprenylphospho-beta-D-ribofuranose 2-oxidase
MSRDSLSNNLDKFSNGLPIGLGRSYGDSGLNGIGISWSSQKLKKIEVDPNTGVAICESGVTIGELEREALRFGYFPPTVPGTEFVTIGGAFASNIHGKSHHVYGSFADNVVSIVLRNSKGQDFRLAPDDDSREKFWATAGGMGLTGFIISAEIKLVKVDSSYFNVEEKRVANFTELIATILDFDEKFSYSVAWIDCSGNFIGRGLVLGGNHASKEALPKKIAKEPFQIDSPNIYSLPRFIPNGIINRLSIRLFNELWFRKKTKSGYINYQPFLHPLDFISNWNEIYGKKGFIEYQFQIPFGSEDYLSHVLLKMKEYSAYSFLTVLKKFGQSDNPYLSFPTAGWTLSVDIPGNTKNLLQLLEELDNLLIKKTGKIYLTKDVRMSSESFRKMYPDFEKWNKIRLQMEPNNYWQSKQSERLGI